METKRGLCHLCHEEAYRCANETIEAEGWPDVGALRKKYHGQMTAIAKRVGLPLDATKYVWDPRLFKLPEWAEAHRMHKDNEAVAAKRVERFRALAEQYERQAHSDCVIVYEDCCEELEHILMCRRHLLEAVALLEGTDGKEA